MIIESFCNFVEVVVGIYQLMTGWKMENIT